MTQRYSALICALFASLMLSQMPAHANDLDDVKARGTLKVAVPRTSRLSARSALT